MSVVCYSTYAAQCSFTEIKIHFATFSFIMALFERYDSIKKSISLIQVDSSNILEISLAVYLYSLQYWLFCSALLSDCISLRCNTLLRACLLSGFLLVVFLRSRVVLRYYEVVALFANFYLEFFTFLPLLLYIILIN